ncbi:hypothetical protein BKA56DRAFT_589456 [Ilyonectria sp. MPI-CAGE-AT-0026]|nr:hypothetical protein BKA56DRAFT_589456 [Ilyonectria sp. MPI-CAGE-AT-0026]
MAGPPPIVIQFSGWFLLAVAAVVIIARLYLRLKIQKRKLITSDIFMCSAWVSGASVASLNVYLEHLGVLEPDLKTDMVAFKGDPKSIPRIFKTFWMSNVPFSTTLYLSQATLLSMYLKMFPEFMLKRRIFLWATIVYVAAAYITSMSLVFFICNPIDQIWKPTPGSNCSIGRGNLVFVVNWAIHIVADILVFFLPWLVITGLKMRWTLRIGLYCTFLLGIINIIFDTFRFVLIRTSYVGQPISTGLITLWSTLDCNIGIVIACLPALRPYFSASESSQDDLERYSTRQFQTPLKAMHTGATALFNKNGRDEHWDDTRKSNGSDAQLVQGEPRELI